MKNYKKKLLFILMVCLICQSFIIGFNQQKYSENINSNPKGSDDDYESNDSYDQATPIQNVTQYESFILLDVDWFVLSLEAGCNITIIIQTDSDLADMEISFYESDGFTLVADALIGGNGILWIIAASNLTQTGNYYISLLPLGDPFAYNIYIMSGYDDRFEENDVIAEAFEITENFEEYLLWCFDDDWFKIYLEEGWGIDIELTYLITDSFELNLIGTDGTTILNASDEQIYENSGGISKIVSYNESVINETGYYYIKISSDVPTVYFFNNDIHVVKPFEEMSTFLFSIQNYNQNEIRIYWRHLENVEFYYIFREESLIMAVDGLTPYATTQYTNFEETIEENGTYYYVVIGNNGTHNSSISNCVNISIISFEEMNITLYLYQNGQEITLDWMYLGNMEIYIFRETSLITTAEGLTPIASTEYSHYDDILTENDTYYYVIMGNNGTHNSSISNCVNVTFILYPFNEIVPELEPIIPSNDEDGSIHLDWAQISNTSHYYIFRETSPISSITDLTPIVTRTYPSYTDQINANGTYYYVIVANNGTTNSSISNCENVTCSIIPFYEQEPYILRIYLHWSLDGGICLEWTPINKAIKYYIYRDTEPISDIEGLNPIATAYDYVFVDQVNDNGTYYYVIVASNGITDSRPSSCKYINISVPYFVVFSENAPFLFEIDPNPSSTGMITLEWEKVEGAMNYYIYRETSPITTITGLTPIASSYHPYNQSWHERQYFSENISERGTYYYVVVAYNGEDYSSISNCESVAYPEREKIKVPGFDILTFILVFSSTVSIIIVSIRNKRNSKKISYLNTS